MAWMQDNLLTEGQSKRAVRLRCVFVLFGATGDLAGRKIAPALYNLAADGLIDDGFVVLGVARRPKTDEQYREEMLKEITEFSRQKPRPEVWQEFSKRWFYHSAAAGDAAAYQGLAKRLGELDSQFHTGGNRLFYIASTPDTFAAAINNLAQAGLASPSREGAFARLVVEKPFGHDLSSAHDLNSLAQRTFGEGQVFRIDHYLGKETVLNILAMRFANAVFEPLLNRNSVEQVQITVSETVGMEDRRGPYYEQAGALRDMIQNHLLQLVALTAMEVPLRLSPDDIRNEKVKALHAIRPMTPQDVGVHTVRGQYIAPPGGPEGVVSYRQEKGVDPNSQTETFVALKLAVDNWRWAGVPFYLRTGKMLAAKTSQIAIIFRREPIGVFLPSDCDLRGPNSLIIRIHPDEGITLVIDAKVPGPDMLLRPVKMGFQYKSSFEWASPEAYEHLLLDALVGDATLFIRHDEVEAAWRFTDSILMAWRNTGAPALVEYEAGTWGPSQAQQLFEDPYQKWYD